MPPALHPVWTALQNAAVASWLGHHGRHHRVDNPDDVDTEFTADGCVICECSRCGVGVVFGRNGDAVMGWGDLCR